MQAALAERQAALEAAQQEAQAAQQRAAAAQQQAQEQQAALQELQVGLVYVGAVLHSLQSRFDACFDVVVLTLTRCPFSHACTALVPWGLVVRLFAEMCQQAKAESDAAGASAELADERDSLAAELQQSQQALDSMQVCSGCSMLCRVLLGWLQCVPCDGHVTGRVTKSDPGKVWCAGAAVGV